MWLGAAVALRDTVLADEGADGGSYLLRCTPRWRYPSGAAHRRCNLSQRIEVDLGSMDCG